MSSFDKSNGSNLESVNEFGNPELNKVLLLLLGALI